MLGAQGGLLTLANWPNDLGDFSIYWPLVPGDWQANILNPTSTLRPCYTARADVPAHHSQGHQPMQQPLEERVASLEDAAQRHERTLARLASIAENHDQLKDRMQANQEKIASLLEELTRDSATRRLWLRLAQR